MKKEGSTIPHRKACLRPEGSMSWMSEQVISHSAPYFYDAGTLTAADKGEIVQKTGVSVNIRERKQWNFQRGLTASGPPAHVEQALALADAKIIASARATPRPDEAVRARRKEVAQAGRRKLLEFEP